MEDLRTMVDGYDCGIRHMDEHIGAIFELLENKGVMDDLVVIITADHGENMGSLAFTENTEQRIRALAAFR